MRCLESNWKQCNTLKFNCKNICKLRSLTKFFMDSLTHRIPSRHKMDFVQTQQICPLPVNLRVTL